MRMKKIFILLCFFVFALLATACRADDENDSTTENDSIITWNEGLPETNAISLYMSESPSVRPIRDAQMRFNSLSLNIETLSADNLTDAVESFKDRASIGKINVAFISTIEEYSQLVTQNPNMVIVCVFSIYSDNYYGVVFHQDFVEKYPMTVALFVAAILARDENVAIDNVIHLGRIENFNLFGIGTGNVLGSPVGILSELGSAIDRRPLNMLTNSPRRTIHPQQLTPIFLLNDNVVYTTVPLRAVDSLSVRVVEMPDEGEVTFRWYDYHDRENPIATGHQLLVDGGIESIPPRKLYAVAIHTIIDMHGREYAIGTNQIYVIVPPFEPGVAMGNDGNNNNEEASPVIRAMEFVFSVIRINGVDVEIEHLEEFYVNEESFLIFTPTIDGEDFDFQWYQWHGALRGFEPILGEYRNIFDLDTSTANEEGFIFHMVAIHRYTRERFQSGNVHVIVREALLPDSIVHPETPIITIYQTPEYSSNIIVGDPVVILRVDTQLDELSDDGEVHLTYQWYFDGSLIYEGRELHIYTDRADTRRFEVRVTNYDLRATSESRVAYDIAEHIVTINEPGRNTVRINIDFASTSSEVTQEDQTYIKEYFQEGGRIRNAITIVDIQIVNSSNRDGSPLAFERREAVYRVLVGDEDEGILGNAGFTTIRPRHLGWGATTGSGSRTTIHVIIEER